MAPRNILRNVNLCVIGFVTTKLVCVPLSIGLKQQHGHWMCWKSTGMRAGYNPFGTAVQFWGQTLTILRNLNPQTGLEYYDKRVHMKNTHSPNTGGHVK